MWHKLRWREMGSRLRLQTRGPNRINSQATAGLQRPYHGQIQREAGVKAAQGRKRAASALRRVGVYGWVSLVCATAGLFGGTGVSEGDRAEIIRTAAASVYGFKALGSWATVALW